MTKKQLLATALAGIALLAVGPGLNEAQAQININVPIGQPSYYGPLELLPGLLPRLYYSNPTIIQPPYGSGAQGQPLYLRVPPGQLRNWRNYCGRYNACNRPVYFVQDNWYQQVYAPRLRRDNNGKPGWSNNPGLGNDKNFKQENKNNKHDDKNGNNGGNGKGKGQGKSK